MTDKELEEFIYVGENKFIELAMIFGDAWPSKAMQIAAEYKALLTQPDTLFVTEFNSKNYLWWKDHNGKLKHAVISKPEETVNGWPLFSGIPQPPKKKWVGLTDKEVEQVLFTLRVKTMGVTRTEDMVRAIEAKLKEKNT